jgi:hypothetical protein
MGTMTGPLAKSTAETADTLLHFPPPTWLKHQPIFMMPYEPFDGPYVGDTDAKYLSTGIAQWRNPDDPYPLSAKIWRFVGEKWSRMSEELPLHRVVDLCIFIVKVFYQKHHTNVSNPIAIIGASTFENQTEKMELQRIGEVPADFSKENDHVRQRLRKLRDELIAANLG